MGGSGSRKGRGGVWGGVGVGRGEVQGGRGEYGGKWE